MESRCVIECKGLVQRSLICDGVAIRGAHRPISSWHSRSLRASWPLSSIQRRQHLRIAGKDAP